MSISMRLGIFGGTFNPIHFGHLRVAEEVRDVCSLDRVLFLPSGIPPLKDTGLAAAEHRYAMTAAATASNRYFEVSDLEIRQPGKSYTVDTLKTLCAHHAGDEIFLILGMDAFLELPLWRRPETLVTMVDFIVVSRPGHEVGNISGTPYVKRTSADAVPGAGEDTVPPPAESASESPSLPYPSHVFDLTSGRKALVIAVTPLDISSTGIRRLVRSGRSITYLVPGEVESYILARGLYKH